MSRIDLNLDLDAALVARARAEGPLNRVMEDALRCALDPAEIARRRQWAEDHALLIESAVGAEEARGA